MTIATVLRMGALSALAVTTLSAQVPLISLTTRPTPLLLGQNQFEVTLKTAKGQPIGNADVTVTLVMPPMPALNHPEMRSEAKLKLTGPGKYSGIVMVTMAGSWNADVAVRKAGKVIGRKRMTLKAQERK